MKKINKITWISFGLCAIAAAIRLWGLSNGLPDVLHPDENMLVRRAVRIGTGDFNPHFFYYPSLSIYLYAALHGLYYVSGMATGAFHSTADFARVFFTDPTWFYLLPRLLICLSDVASVFFIIKIGIELFDEKTGSIAGLTWVLFPQGLSESQIAKPDALMVCLALFSLWVLIRSSSNKNILLSGLILGLSVSAKYQSVIIVPIYMLWILRHGQSWREQTPRCFLFGLLVAAGFAIGTPFSILSPAEFLKDFQAQSEVMRLGIFGLEGGPQGWKIYLKGFFLPGGSALLGMAIVIGTILCVNKKKDIILIVIGIPLILFFGLSVHRIASVHYMYLCYPFLFLLASYGLIELCKKFRKDGKYLMASAYSLLAICLIPFYSDAWAHMRKFTDIDTRISGRQWIEKNIPSGSLILADASAPTLNMAVNQLDDLYQRSKSVGHIKADYFRLLKEYSREPTYVVFLTKQAIMASPKKLVEYSRSVQDLISIENGLDWIKSQGIQYIIVSSNEADQYLNPEVRKRHPNFAKFYEDLETKGVLIKTFEKSPWRTGPSIKIYKM